VSGCGQGSESGEHTQHIGSRGSDGKIGRGCFEYEINFLLERGWLERRTVNRSVRGAQYNLLVPGNGKQHSAVACLWHHERVRRRTECPVNHEVNALAGADRWRIAWCFHAKYVSDKHSRGVDHGLRPEREVSSALGIESYYSCYFIVVFFDKTRYTQVIDCVTAFVENGLHEVDHKSCIIELPVVVEYTTA